MDVRHASPQTSISPDLDPPPTAHLVPRASHLAPRTGPRPSPLRAGKPSNDLHTLDMKTMLWRRIHTEGAPPAPRVGHSATQLGLAMIVFGGFSKGKYFHDVHMLDVERLGWA